MSDFEQFQQKLNELQNVAETAKRDLIVSQTNLENLKSRRDELVQECEAYAGVPITDVTNVLNEKRMELETIMQRLSNVNITDIKSITDVQLNELDAIINEFKIPEVQS
jgi:hypothetical protein